MPIAVVNGVRLHYDEYGSGEPVVLVGGSAARGRVWTLHQVPALTAAGYRVITIDNRGIPPTEVGPGGFTLDDMAADTRGLIKYLGIRPCRIVGFSLGAMIVQEVLVAEPEIVSRAVLMATRGRTDKLRGAMITAEQDLVDNGISLPPRYLAVIRAVQNLSARTRNDESLITNWLDIFELSPIDRSVARAQMGVEAISNRLPAYSKIQARCLVIGFSDDVMCPPHFGCEIAAHIPDCRYQEIPECGHYGYLENPDAVNEAIITFFAEGQGRGRIDDEVSQASA
jgi:pimeloyl-ACP methyl ester carboxylesterase